MELLEKLGVEEICGIIGRMGRTTSLEQHSGELEYNGTIYNYIKNGNELLISDDTGKKTRVWINYSEIPFVDPYNRNGINIKREVGIDYLLENGEYITLYNENVNVGHRGYQAYEDVHRHVLRQGLTQKYYDAEGNEICSFSTDLNTICLPGSKTMYEFKGNGITVDRKFVSNDGSVLYSISGDQVPSKEFIDSFDYEKELGKITQMMEKWGKQEGEEPLHDFTIEALLDGKRALARKQRYAQNISEYYNKEKKDVERVIAIRDRLIDQINRVAMDAQALNAVSRDYYNSTLEFIEPLVDEDSLPIPTVNTDEPGIKGDTPFSQQFKKHI